MSLALSVAPCCLCPPLYWHALARASTLPLLRRAASGARRAWLAPHIADPPSYVTSAHT